MTKPKCLGAFATNRITRGWKPIAVGKFFENFRWLPFLLQAGQAVYSLTGYGIVLGGVMSVVGDSIWSLLRLGQGASIRVDGPPPSDPLGKALRYLSQPSYHVSHSALMTYEEHYLLAAADAVAVQIVAAASSPALLAERYSVMESARVIEYEPWAPDTIAGLAKIGYQKGGAQVEPLSGLSGAPTYGDVWRSISATLPAWWSAVASEFPKSSAATFFAYMVSETGREVFDWLNESAGSVQPVFEPQEFAIARMFETGVFPLGDPQPDLLGEFAQRAAELAQAAGRQFPGAGDIRLALDETFGGSRPG